MVRSRIMFGTREYAFAPLRQCLASLVTMQRLFDICVEGLDIVSRLPGDLESLPHSKDRKPGDELNFCLSMDNAQFSQNEREQGFPLLHSYTLVSVWGALEAGIEDMLVSVTWHVREFNWKWRIGCGENGFQGSSDRSLAASD